MVWWRDPRPFFRMSGDGSAEGHGGRLFDAYFQVPIVAPCFEALNCLIRAFLPLPTPALSVWPVQKDGVRSLQYGPYSTDTASSPVTFACSYCFITCSE